MEEVDELAVALRHDIGKYIRHRIIYPVEQDARNKTAGAGIWAGIKGEGYQATLQTANTGGNAILTALISVFSSVITLVIFLKTKWTPLTRSYLLSKIGRAHV